ncbi:MAG TPA: HK97 family phage prohead protease [Microbacteriaceae bacterium]|nr:HK97 family phage prohead protease [Microbacteriaceae bacterium]
MTETERRLTVATVEVRAEQTRTIGGYAAKFNTFSQNLGGFIERIATSFFNKSRGDGWPGVLARYNHDDNMLLGTTAADTLRLAIDDIGLSYEVDAPAARADVFELVQRGDVAKSSFAFNVFEDDWSVNESGFPIRTLISGRLYDVAPVNTPAYDDTSVGIRALDSLARKFDCDLAEIRNLAADQRLGDLFAPPAIVVDLAPAPVVADSTERSARAALAKALSLT